MNTRTETEPDSLREKLFDDGENFPDDAKPFAEVVFNLPLQGPFTYIIPPRWRGNVQVGMRVLVPFGRRRITGYVVNFADKWDKPIALKTIADLPDAKPIMNAEMLSLTRWLGRYYQSSWGEAIRAALPAGLDKIADQRVKFVRLARCLPDEKEIARLLKRSPKQKSVFDFLRQKEISLSKLKARISGSPSAVRGLKEKKLAEVFGAKKEHAAFVPESAANQTFVPPPAFTPGQEAIFKKLAAAIDDGRFQPFLLHGITGSGKTEVYIRCIQRTLEKDKTAIMMVPEISLTPQTVARFRQRFGDRMAVLHSGLSQTERYLEWKKIRDGKVSIAVGARSAVFAPFENLGVIVIDEEHDGSYKQDATPRYHARDTAVMRARSSNAVVIMGSATPSLESIQNTRRGKYDYLSLEDRIGGRMLPVVSMVDMRRERREFKNFAMLSRIMCNAIRDRLSRKEQVFLFLNRRGTARFVFCPDCGYVLECARCSVTLTFHGKEDRLLCHYCNFTARMPRRCVECNGAVIRCSGFGTQKLEEEVRKLFPTARITRLDRDTTRRRGSFAAMHRNMNAGKIDILIGTQMITKGHDFPNVTLVGVVHADLSLNIPDFRSCEKAFQLLTQVAGRAGRGEVPGKAIIQTNNPNHYMFEFVREHDVNAFHAKELKLRRRLNYPPFARLIAVEIVSATESIGKNAAGKLARGLARRATRQNGVEVLGPSKAALYRIQNKFRWHLILRGQNMQTLQSILADSRELRELKSAGGGKLKLSVDVDPFNLL